MRAVAAFLVLTIASMAAAGEVSLAHPEGLCFDNSGRLYVADTNHHRVLVFSPKLELVRAIGSEGAEQGQFRQPADVALDSRGRIIVVETGNNRVQVLTPDGKPVKVIGGPAPGSEDGQFRRPTKIACDGNDNLIVSDTWNHRLQVFAPDGTHRFTLANRTGPMPIEQIKPDKDGKKTQRDWQRTDPGQFNEPGGVFVDRELNRLFVANGWNCRAEVLDYDPATGRIARRPEETGIVWGWWVTKGIAGDARGRLIGCDTGFGKLKAFDNRSSLTNQSKAALTIEGGAYGRMRDVTDVAVAPNGDLAVTDAAHNRVVIFPADGQLPSSPRVLRTDRTQVVVAWRTLKPAAMRLLLREGSAPERTPGQERPWDTAEVRTVEPAHQLQSSHELTIPDLKPGTRYYYRVACPSLRSIPATGWSREYAFATAAAEGQTAFLRIPVKILLLANVLHLDAVTQDAPFPEPMPEAEVELYRAAFRETQRFYWCNSRMKYWLDFDLYVDPTFTRAGRDRDDLPERYGKLPKARPDESLRKLVAAAGREKTLYVGRVVCTAERRWQANTKQWAYQGSGGGTYGLDWPQPGRSNFLGGSDVAWLLCHEYKHQFESQFSASGLDSEDDRSIFCHFSPQYPGWRWCTAYDHGEHWDGIAYDLRHLTPVQYARNLYGEWITARDSDDDGIPDDDPRLPLDEKRFGSSPKSRDTDGDGLDDLGEVLASTWVTALNAALRQRVSGKWARPDPARPDSDGDGIRDGDDPYPLYPFRPRIPRGAATIDGRLDEWGAKPMYWLDHAGVKLQGWARWDDDYLYYAFALRGPYRKLTLVVDQDADGFYVGGDNVYAEFVPTPRDGPRKANVRMHYCNLGRWPWFDDKHEFVKPEAFPFASARVDGADVVEFALPRNEMCGLSLRRGETVGMALYIGIPDKGAISLFEPWSLFDSTLEADAAGPAGAE